ncbi:hypothetical protein AAMO2058_001732600 [Amorphochlora amoebiformis]
MEWVSSTKSTPEKRRGSKSSRLSVSRVSLGEIERDIFRWLSKESKTMSCSQITRVLSLGLEKKIRQTVFSLAHDVVFRYPHSSTTAGNGFMDCRQFSQYLRIIFKDAHKSMISVGLGRINLGIDCLASILMRMCSHSYHKVTFSDARDRLLSIRDDAERLRVFVYLAASQSHRAMLEGLLSWKRSMRVVLIAAYAPAHFIKLQKHIHLYPLPSATSKRSEKNYSSEKKSRGLRKSSRSHPLSSSHPRLAGVEERKHTPSSKGRLHAESNPGSPLSRSEILRTSPLVSPRYSGYGFHSRHSIAHLSRNASEGKGDSSLALPSSPTPSTPNSPHAPPAMMGGGEHTFRAILRSTPVLPIRKRGSVSEEGEVRREIECKSGSPGEANAICTREGRNNNDGENSGIPCHLDKSLERDSKHEGNINPQPARQATISTSQQERIPLDLVDLQPNPTNLEPNSSNLQSISQDVEPVSPNHQSNSANLQPFSTDLQQISPDLHVVSPDAPRSLTVRRCSSSEASMEILEFLDQALDDVSNLVKSNPSGYPDPQTPNPPPNCEPRQDTLLSSSLSAQREGSKRVLEGKNETSNDSAECVPGLSRGMIKRNTKRRRSEMKIRRRSRVTGFASPPKLDSVGSYALRFGVRMIRQTEIETLQAMGFVNDERTIGALIVSHGDVATAAEILIKNHDSRSVESDSSSVNSVIPSSPPSPSAYRPAILPKPPPPTLPKTKSQSTQTVIGEMGLDTPEETRLISREHKTGSLSSGINTTANQSSQEASKTLSPNFPKKIPRIVSKEFSENTPKDVSRSFDLERSRETIMSTDVGLIPKPTPPKYPPPSFITRHKNHKALPTSPFKLRRKPSYAEMKTVGCQTNIRCSDNSETKQIVFERAQEALPEALLKSHSVWNKSTYVG